eukprot:1153181-Pelagomonas_calceolata.AAC.3
MELIYVRCNSKQFITKRMTWKLACSCTRRRTNRVVITRAGENGTMSSESFQLILTCWTAVPL